MSENKICLTTLAKYPSKKLSQTQIHIHSVCEQVTALPDYRLKISPSLPSIARAEAITTNLRINVGWRRLADDSHRGYDHTNLPYRYSNQIYKHNLTAAETNDQMGAAGGQA